MITFLEFITESESLSHIWTAVKRKSDGKILRYQRNSEHADIRWKHAGDDGKPAEGEAGYYDSRNKKFMTRQEFSQISGDGSGDSTRLRSSADRMKFAGDDPFGLEKSKGTVSSHDRQTAVSMARRGIFEKHEAIDEGNPLAKVAKALENKGKRGKTSYMATISADRGGMSKNEKREAHGRLQSAIRRHIEKGMLKMIGGPKQSGEYRYADPEPGEEGVAKEKSYVLAPGKHPKARGNFHRIMKKLGRDAGQESVLKVTKVGKNRPAGSLLYTTGPKTGTSEKVGRMHMNVDMPTGSGRTKFKNKDASIVVKENDDK